jgi:hypothetical protein
MDENDLTDTIINPYYAITIHPDLAGEHPTITTQDQWVEANLRLIEEIGSRQWLERLLAILRGADSNSPESVDD